MQIPGTPGVIGGLNGDQHQAMDDAIAALRAAGATIVDPAALA